MANVAVAVGANAVDFSLGPQATISGHVSPRAGGPVGATTVSAQSRSSSTFGNFGVSTDTAGIFTMAGLPAGTYDLVFSRAGYAVESRHDVIIAAGQTATVPDTTQVLAGRISGALTNHKGAASRVAIGAFLDGKLVASTVTTAGGAFVIDGLVPGSYLVKTTGGAAFETAANTTLAEGQAASGLALHLEPGGTVSGTGARARMGWRSPTRRCSRSRRVARC